VAAVAGAFAFQAFVALHAGQCHVGRHDLVLDAPVHARVDPLVFAAARQMGGLHAGGIGLLPVQVFPVSRRILLVLGNRCGTISVPCSRSAAKVRGFLRLRESLPGTRGEILADVNRKFTEDVEYSGQFMTLFLARIDRGARRMEWVRARHDPGAPYDSQRVPFAN